MEYQLNIVFQVKEELEEVVMTWINDVFAPIIYDPEIGFKDYELYKVISPNEPDYKIITIQIHGTNRKYLTDWFEISAIPVCNDLYSKYADAEGFSDVTIYPSVMERLK